MYLTIEGGMRGGIATISKQHTVANNPDVEGYDPTQPNCYITYLDANSLYATAQSQPLPVSDFRILVEQEMRDFDLDSIATDAPTGYILECDLQCPNTQTRAELAGQTEIRDALQEPAAIQKARSSHQQNPQISFTQSAWLKPWIELCNEQRKLAKSNCRLMPRSEKQWRTCAIA